MIDTLPNASDWVAATLMAALSGVSKDAIDYRKREARSKVMLYENALVEAKSELMAAENASDIVVSTALKSDDERLKLLEMQRRFERSPEELLDFYGSRTDILDGCGFKSPSEATEWTLSNYNKRKVSK